MAERYYIASCMFTRAFPELSLRIRDIAEERYGLRPVRCCVPRYKLDEMSAKLPEEFREAWNAMPDSADFKPGDEIYSFCHNCNNIIEESRPGTRVRSFYELLAGDPGFRAPDRSGLKAVVQDCWRSRDRAEEQAAVRKLLADMNIEYVEAEKNHEDTAFCGMTLYRAQPPRNPKLAPRHYVDGAAGLFVPHTEEEQKRIMREYCASLPMKTVVCYCHYCYEGLKAGGADAQHIAQLLFP